MSKGDRLPSTPEHNIKVGTDYAFTNKFSLGATASYFSSQYSSFGLYGEPDEAPGLDTLNDERFVGAGAPRAGWIGIKVSM